MVIIRYVQNPVVRRTRVVSDVSRSSESICYLQLYKEECTAWQDMCLATPITTADPWLLGCLLQAPVELKQACMRWALLGCPSELVVQP